MSLFIGKYSLLIRDIWFLSHHRVQTGAGAHPASYTMDTGGKAAGSWS